MYSSLHIPAFPLAVLLRDDPASHSVPIALLGTPSGASSRTAPTLLSVNHPAIRAGLTPGMTSTRALARCPRLQLLNPDPLRERESMIQLRDFAASLTPDFEETAPGTILLDLFTLPHAQDDPADWTGHTLRKATALRLPLHLTCAPTPDLAHLAALSFTTSSTLSFHPEPDFEIQSAADTSHLLFQLPLSSFQLPGSGFQLPDSNLLQLWGITTLGELATLPRQGLAERLGPESARLHDILHAKHHRLLTLHRPPQHFLAKQELEYPLDSLEPLLFLLHRSLDTLCSRLVSSQRAAHAMLLSLTFDDGNLHLRELRIPDPTRDPAILLRLLHTHLDTLAAPSPVTAFSLKLLPTLPGESQHQLFERALRDPNKFADTLARIEALLGPHRLGTPVPLDTHKPDAFDLRSTISNGHSSPRREAPSSRITNNQSPITATALPLKRYRPAIEIHVASEPRDHHHRPLALLNGPHPGPIAAAHGPFPLSGHWWNPADRWQRVEWDIQLQDHTLLRLAHLPPREWKLEGTYT